MRHSMELAPCSAACRALSLEIMEDIASGVRKNGAWFVCNKQLK
jgi:hypothetical protein